MLKTTSLVLLFLLLPSAKPADIFHSIRQGDPAAVRIAAADAPTLEKTGRLGATPLLYAAAFGDAESVRILLEAGADPDARTPLGATALIWAAGDPAKTRLLVEAGADVNLTSKSGRTALIAAAARDGVAPIISLLLEGGANASAVDANGVSALLAAALAGDIDSVRLLLDAGADANQADKAGNTPMHFAAANDDPEMIALLLARGARVDDTTTSGGAVRHGDIALRQLTPLMLAAPRASATTVKALLAAGAAPNARDCRDMTPLMLAVASSNQDARVVRTLLENGAEVNAVSKAGETALDWAAKFGDRDVMAALERAGAKRSKRPAPPAPVRRPSRDAQQSIAQAITLLQRSEASFFERSACIGCHHQNAIQVATAAARRAEIDFDETAEAQSIAAVRAQWSAFSPALLERIDPPGSPDNQLFSLFGLAVQGAAPDEATDALYTNVVAQQVADGSWRLTGFGRDPFEESHLARTAMAVRGLTAFAPPARRKDMDVRSARALAWIEAQKPRTTDELVWRLVGLLWANAEAKQVGRSARRLIAEQNHDGGWSPRPGLPSDPYATATALWALNEANAAAADSEPYRKGTAYLLSTQQEDGSWFVQSRSPKFQPLFESGFPHGDDQWISTPATAWAVAALAPATRVRQSAD